MADAPRPEQDARCLRGPSGCDPEIDPSPAYLAMEQLVAEYEQTIAGLRAEIAELRS